MSERVAGERVKVGSGGRFEPIYGYSRAVRVGDRVVVSGTGPTMTDGNDPPTSPGDQLKRCMEIVELALEQAGSSLSDVIRTRLYLISNDDSDEAGKAHAEVFGDILPSNTIITVKELLDPRWKVEVEVEAVVAGSPTD